MLAEQSRPVRRFNTLDGIILVAALALWLSVVPGNLHGVPRALREVCELGFQLAGLTPWTTPNPRWIVWIYLHAAIHNVIAPLPFLFGHLVPAVLILGLRRPRPSWG